MSLLAAIRPSHFLPSLLLLAAGWLAATVGGLNEFFVSLFNVLPTLLLSLGGAFCLAYGRQREAFLLLVIYLGYFLLDTQADYYRDHGTPLPEAPLIFHLISLLLPLLYGLQGAWRERSHLVQDLVARSAVLLAIGGVFAGLAQRYPQGLLDWLTETRWTALQASWMNLIQLSYLAFLVAALVLVVQYLRRPRPLHAAYLIGLFGLLWMLPRTFNVPLSLNIISSLVMLMTMVAVAHEAYLMAFHDELTGLPGRRALNERLQRLGRNYVIAMADVDHFKKFNDTHGHDVGDQVLRLVASQLRKVGGGGKAYRYGGEEFTLVFPGKSLADCLPHLEAVRSAVEHYPLQLRDRGQRPRNDREGRQQRGGGRAGSVSVSISIGVAERQQERSFSEVIRAADKALYSAKAAGRNCVRAHGRQHRGAVREPSKSDTVES